MQMLGRTHRITKTPQLNKVLTIEEQVIERLKNKMFRYSYHPIFAQDLNFWLLHFSTHKTISEVELMEDFNEQEEYRKAFQEYIKNTSLLD